MPHSETIVFCIGKKQLSSKTMLRISGVVDNKTTINHFSSKGYNRLSAELIKINESYDCVDVCGNSLQNTSKRLSAKHLCRTANKCVYVFEDYFLACITSKEVVSLF